MFTLVAGVPAAAGELIRRPMNFSHDVPGWPALPYCLHVPTEELVRLFQPHYDTFLREALADAQDFPDDWPELAAVVEAGCPPLADMPTRLPESLADILRDSTPLELLDVLLPGAAGVNIRYLANTLDHVTVDPEWVTVCGRACPVERSE